MRLFLVRLLLLTIGFTALNSSISMAQLSSKNTTYQARIIKPDNTPLENSNVAFSFTILDPSATCSLYVETFSNIDMTDSGGNVAFTLGTGVSSYISAGHTDMMDIFNNNPTAPFACQAGGTYSPTNYDSRKITMAFQISGLGWQVLPATAINSVPYANYANQASRAVSATFAATATSATTALNLNGYTENDFATSAGLGVCPGGEVLTYTISGFDCIPLASVSGTLNNITVNSPLVKTGTVSSPILSLTQATSATNGYLSSADYILFSQKLAATSAAITTALGAEALTVSSTINLSGDVTGTTTSNTVATVGGKSAAQVSTSVDDTLAASASAAADTIAKRDSSGNIQFNNLGSNITSANQFRLFNGSNSISFLSPVLASSYTLTFPVSSGAVGQVLTTDGSGILSWSSPSVGSVTNVSATAPLASTGGATPTISISQASPTVDGYLAAVDFTSFLNKVTSVSVTPYLTVTGTVSSPTIDLADVGSTVVSGTQYTKLTVDGKGRVVSGAQLVASDIPNLDTSKLTTGTLPFNRGGTGLNVSGTANQILGMNAAQTALEYKTVSAGANISITNNAGELVITASNPGGTVTNVSATAPLASTGGTTPTISISQSSVTVDGYLAAVDFSSFLNKVTSVSVTPYLTVTGTVSSPTIDLADVGSTITSGTQYTKLTVDGKGRVVSGAQLVAADIPNLDAAKITTGTLAVAQLPSLAGDVSSASGSNTITVDRIKNISVSLTAIASNQILQYNGTQFVNKQIPTCGPTEYLTFDGTTYSCVTDSGSAGTIASVSGTVNEITVTSGTNAVVSLANNGVVSGTYTKVVVDSKGRVSSGTSLVAADIPNLDTSKLTTGTLPFNRGGTGLSVSGTANQILGMNAAQTALEYKTVSAGANISITNNAGELVITASNPGGTVTNVSATAPLASTGGATPTLSISQATSATNGYLSSTDWLIFNNKLTTLDLGSVSATGTLAIARLPSLAGDVSSVSGSNNITVNYVGGLSSATIATAITQTASASSLNVSNTLVRRDGSGNFAASRGTFENSVVIKDGSVGGAISIYAPVGFTGYNLTLPSTSGTVGQVLTTNGVGVLSWTDPNAGSVLSVTGTVNEVSVTGSASSPVVGLADNGVTSGTYTKITVDSKGRVSSGTSLVAADIPNLDTSKLTTGTLPFNRGGTGLNVSGTANQILGMNAAQTALEYKTVSAGANISITNNAGELVITASNPGGTVTNVSATAPLASTGGATPTISISQATSATNGYLSFADWNIFNNKLTTLDLGSVSATGTLAIARLPSLAGDVSSVSGSNIITVDRIKNISVSLTAIASNQILQYNGTQFVNKQIPTCSGTEYLTFNGTNYVCVTDSGSAGAIASVSGTVNEITVTSGTNAVISLANNGVTSGTYTKITVDSKGRVSSGTSLVASDIPNLETTKITSGTFSVARGGTGVNTLAVSGILIGNGTNPVNTVTPGSSGTVLTINGSGTPVWLSPASVGTVTNVSATAPLASTGGATPTLSISQATSATNGYLAAVDFTSFLNKVTSVSVTPYLTVTGTVSSPVIDLADVGSKVTSGTQYTKLTVDGKGRVVSGAQLVAADIPNLDTSKLTTGVLPFQRGGTGLNVSGTANQILGMNAAQTALEYKTVSAGANISITNNAGELVITASNPGGTVTNVSATAPLASTGGATPTISISQATSATNGYLSSTDWRTFNNKLTTLDLGSVSATGTLATARLPSLAGDVSSVSGSNNITVDRIKNISVSLTAVASNQILQYNGSQFVNKQIPTCSGTEYLTFNGTNYVCVTDSGSAGAIASVSGTVNEITVTSGTNAVISLANNGVTSGTYTKITVDSKGRVSSGTSLVASDIPNLETTKITSGTFAVARGGTGVNTLAVSGILIGNGTNPVNTVSPGSSGTVLTINSSGTPVWLSPSITGAVTNVSATAPLASTGGATPTISISQATSATNGYLAAADFTSFLNKVTSVSVTPYLTVTGSVSSPIIDLADVGSKITSGTQYTKLTVDGKGRVVSGAQLVASDIPNLDTTKITSGTFVVARGGTGVNTLAVSGILIGNGTNPVNTVTPGSSGTVLTINSSGTPVWLSPSITGAVTNVSATAPLASTGGATPTLSISQATSATNGYLSSTDWRTFNNKLTTLDLGSVSATGTLAIARLPSLAGDVSSVSGSNIITVDRIKNISVSLTAIASNQILQYNGSQFVNKQIPTCSGTEYLTFNGTNYVCVTDSGSAGTIASVSGTANEITVTGTTSAVVSLANNGVTSGTYTKVIVDSKGRVSSGTSLVASDIPNLDTAKITSGTFAVARGGTGVNTLAVSGILIGNGTNPVNTVSPGSSGTVLTINSSGTPVWLSPSITGAVTNVSATAPLASTGGATPTLSISQATSATNGYLSSTDWRTFNNKLTTLDLGSVSATGTLAIARLPSLAGDVSSVSGSNNITVNFVGGLSSATIATAITQAASASSLNVSNTIVKRDASGNFAASAATFENSVVIKDGSVGGAIGLFAPTGFTSYNLTLPTTSGTVGQVLRTNGAGVLSWVNPTSGSVLSVTGVANEVSVTGTVSSPVVGLANNGVIGGTYTKVTVDSKGRVSSGTSLVASDIPDLDTTKITSGTFSVARGGTGVNTLAVSGILIGNGTNPVNTVSPGASGTVLTINTSGTPVWLTPSITSSAVVTALTYVPASASALANYVDLTTAQTITTGAKTFQAADNADTILTGLTLQRLRNNATAPAAGHGVNLNFALESFTNNTTVSAAGITAAWEQTQIDNTTSRDAYLSFSTLLNNTLEEEMRLTSDGKLGIGTSAPVATLDVSGTVKISGGSPGLGKVLTSDANGLASWQTPSAGGSSSFSGLTSATATNTIDNTNFAQTWGWSTLTTQNALTVSASALTTGSLLSLTTPNAAASSTNGLLYVANTGASTNGVVARIQSNSTAGSGLTVRADGNVGVGTATPGTKLDVNGALTATTANIGSGAIGDVFSISGAGSFNNSGGALTLYSQSGKPLNLSTNGSLTNGISISSGGNVGIGTSAPTNRLEVSGTLKFAGSTTPVSGGVLTSDSTGVATWRLPASVSGTQWTTSGTDIYYSTGKVGVGTSTSIVPLHVYGANSTNGIFKVESSNGSESILTVGTTAANTNLVNMVPAGGSVGIAGGSTAARLNVGTLTADGVAVAIRGIAGQTGDLIRIDTGTGTTGSALKMTSAGNLGLGTVSPTATLEVSGTLKFAGSTTPVSGGVLTSDASGNATWALPSGGSSQWTTNGSNIYYNSTGNVGIGESVSAPTYKLSISGTASVNDRTIAINNMPVVYLPDQAGTAFIGSIAFGDGLRSTSHTVGMTGYYNTAVGIGALFSNTTGYNNTGTGYQALILNTTGYANVANGFNALYFNTTGYNNTGTGYQALRQNTTGYGNVANGYQTLSFNTTGYYNSANGAQALMNNTTGSWNVANGYQALTANTTGNNNVANGYYALGVNTTGNSNVANGDRALQSNTTGSWNVADGAWALNANTTGSSNVANGYFALNTSKTKSESTAIGYYSMYYADSVSAAPAISYNTAIGAFSLRGSTTAANNTGLRNTALGHSSLWGMTSGSNNIGIGYNAGASITTLSNNVVIGSNGGSTITTSNTILIADGAGNERVRILNSGNMGIGTTAPAATLDVSGTLKFAGSTTPVSGGVLTSDANGIATWRTPSGGGSSALSGLTAATATNTINNANFAQTWGWSTLTTQNALTLSGSSLTTGSLLNITTPNAAASSTNGLLYVANTSAGTNGVVARIQSNSTAGSGLTVRADGNVGIGTVAPADKLQVVGNIRLTNSNDTILTPEVGGGISARNSANGIILNISQNSGAASTNYVSMMNAGTGFGPVIFTAGVDAAVPLRFWGKGGAPLVLQEASNGNVGVGISTPSAKFEVSGTLKFAGATTPVSGGVLTSDASGNATWALPSGGGSSALSGLTAATATNTINNANFAQTWGWSSLTTQNALTLSGSALTTGSLLSLTTPSTSFNSTNGLLYVANTSASTSGIVARIQSNSTAGSGLSVFGDGGLGIGTTTPNVNILLQLAGGSKNYGLYITGSSTGAYASGSSGGFSGYSAAGSAIDGSTSTGYALYGYASGSGTALYAKANGVGYGVYGLNESTGVGGYFASTSGYGLLVGSGNTGIGTLTPTAKFEVSGTLKFAGSNTPVSGGVLTSDSTGNARWILPSGGAASLSGLTAATATNTINNANFAQTWGWSSLTTQNALTISGSSLTTGSLLSLTTPSAAVSSTNGLLYVANTSAGTNGIVARLQSNSTAGSGLTVRADGNVGVGTSSPAAMLHVSGTAIIAGGQSGGLSVDSSGRLLTGTTINATHLIQQGTLVGIGSDVTNGRSALSIYQSFGNNSAQGEIQFNRGRGSNANPSLSTAGDPIGRINGNGYTGGQFRTATSINFLLDSVTVSATSMPGLITFNTAPLGTLTEVERMRINSSGNVGIGTSSPVATLDVSGTLKIAGATTPVSGGVLTSDANGIATWRAPAGGGSGDFMKNGSVSMTGQFVSTAGTVSLPGIAFVGDLDTGIYSTGANEIGVAAGGVRKIALDATRIGLIGATNTNSSVHVSQGPETYGVGLIGAVGSAARMLVAGNGAGLEAALDFSIGTTNPRWRIGKNLTAESGSNAGSDFFIERFNDASASIDRPFSILRSSGNVGIGTASPGSKLEVAGGMRVGNGTESNPSISFSTDNGIGFSLASTGIMNISRANVAVFQLNSSGLQSVTVSGPVMKLGTPSVAAPAFSFNGDYDTGMSNPAGNNIAFSTAGSEQVRLDASGDVGIGTTTPNMLGASRALTLSSVGVGGVTGLELVGQSASGFGVHSKIDFINRTTAPSDVNVARIEVSNSASDTDAGIMKFFTRHAATSTFAERMRIMDTGNVGIGTSAPATTLEVSGTLKFAGSNTPVSGGVLTSDSTGNARWILPSGGAASLSGLTAATATNTINNANFAQTWGWSSLTTQNALTLSGSALTTGSLLSLTTPNAAVNSTNGLLYVANTSAGTTGTIARIQSNSTAGSGLTVLANGLVGIGTTTPSQRLEVKGDIKVDFVKTTGGTAANPAYHFNAQTNAGMFNPEANNLAFSTSSTERLRINAAGNVGIGTAFPNNKLEVAGGANGLVVTTTDFAIGSAGSQIKIGPVGFTGNVNSSIQVFKTGASTYGDLLLNPTSGNVGIGMTTPSEKLEVSGSVKATSFISTSDRRLKTNIQPVAGLSIVNKLQGVTYNWINGGGEEQGVIAQDVEKVLPSAVVTDEQSGMKAVKYQNLIAPLIESTKELYGLCEMSKQQNEKIERRIANVEDVVKAQQDEIERLKKENELLNKKLDLILEKLK